jgi:hypothetical protein
MRVFCFAVLLLSSACRAVQPAGQAPTLRSVTLAEAREDLKQYFATLERVHPNLFDKADRAEYPAIQRRALAEATAKADAGGMIQPADFAFVLAHAAAFFQDGHTSVDPSPTLKTLTKLQLPPFYLDVQDGHWMIAAAKDPDLRGLELTAVDGRPILDVFRPVIERTSAETAAFRMASAVSWRRQIYSLEFAGLAQPAPASYRLALRDASGKESERVVASLDFGHYVAMLPKGVQARWHEKTAATRVEFPDSGKVAHLIYPAFHDTDTERARIDEAFRKIRDAGAKDLILDLRGNGGGNSRIADSLFSYIYAGPFRQFSESRVKVSRDVFPGKLPGPEGSILSYPIGESIHARPKSFFRGRVYLLTDNATFSTAVSFTTMFRDYQAGQILGFETGGLPVSSGDVARFLLHHSGIACTVSYKLFWPPKPRPGDDRHGVIPDVPLNRALLAPYAADPDPVLAYTLHYIRAR